MTPSFVEARTALDFQIATTLALRSPFPSGYLPLFEARKALRRKDAQYNIPPTGCQDAGFCGLFRKASYSEARSPQDAREPLSPVHSRPSPPHGIALSPYADDLCLPRAPVSTNANATVEERPFMAASTRQQRNRALAPCRNGGLKKLTIGAAIKRAKFEKHIFDPRKPTPLGRFFWGVQAGAVV